MKDIKTHTIFIDTKIDKNQNPSKFKIKMGNWFLRNKILNTDKGKNEWYISVKTLAMFNSFSNISKEINDSIKVYVAIDDTKPVLDSTQSNLKTDYIEHSFKIPEGNPNVTDIEARLNVFLKPLLIDCIYDNYDSTYIFRNKTTDTSITNKYIFFENTFEVMGFDEGKYYLLNNDTIKHFRSDRNVNTMADRLIKFSIDTNISDFRIKNFNYCNHMNHTLFNDCNIFHLQPVNVNPYDLIYYEKSCENLIPIELHKNNISEFTILATNQDGDEIEGLSDYIMVLEFIQIKKYDYDYKIYKILQEMYMWIGSYLFKFI